MNHQVTRLASISPVWRVAARQLCQVIRQAERLAPHSGLDLDSTWSVWRLGAKTWELRESRALQEGGERYGPSSLAEAVDRWLAFLENGTELDLERAPCPAETDGPCRRHRTPSANAGQTMLRLVYDIQLVLELEGHQVEPTLRELEVALEQSTAGEALSLALEDRAARLRLPLPRWADTEA